MSRLTLVCFAVLASSGWASLAEAQRVDDCHAQSEACDDAEPDLVVGVLAARVPRRVMRLRGPGYALLSAGTVLLLSGTLSLGFRDVGESDGDVARQLVNFIIATSLGCSTMLIGGSLLLGAQIRLRRFRRRHEGAGLEAGLTLGMRF